MGDFRIVLLLHSVSDMILFWAPERFTNGFRASRIRSLEKNFIFHDSWKCAVHK